jgi:hypothetical protein
MKSKREKYSRFPSGMSRAKSEISAVSLNCKPTIRKNLNSQFGFQPDMWEHKEAHEVEKLQLALFLDSSVGDMRDSCFHHV